MWCVNCMHGFFFWRSCEITHIKKMYSASYIPSPSIWNCANTNTYTHGQTNSQVVHGDSLVPQHPWEQSCDLWTHSFLFLESSWQQQLHFFISPPVSFLLSSSVAPFFSFVSAQLSPVILQWDISSWADLHFPQLSLFLFFFLFLAVFISWMHSWCSSFNPNSSLQCFMKLRSFFSLWHVLPRKRQH